MTSQSEVEPMITPTSGATTQARRSSGSGERPVRCALTAEIEIGDERLEPRAVVVVAEREQRAAVVLAPAAIRRGTAPWRPRGRSRRPRHRARRGRARRGRSARRAPRSPRDRRARRCGRAPVRTARRLRAGCPGRRARLARAAVVQQEALVDLLEPVGVLGPGQLGPDGAGDGRRHARWKKASAAATTCSISRGPWASETKPASNCEGAR